MGLLAQWEPMSLDLLVPQASPLVLDLLYRMFAFDPTERVTAKEALNHPCLIQVDSN